MKRPWTRGEKSLFLAPLLFLAFAGGAWLWQSSRPVTIKVGNFGEMRHLEFSPEGKRLVGFFYDSMMRTRFAKVFDVQNGSTVSDLARPPRLGANAALYPQTPPYLEAPSWSPDGQQIVASYSDLYWHKASPIDDWIRRSPLVSRRPFDQQLQDRESYISKIAIWNAENGEITGNYYYGPVNEDSISEKVRFSEDGKKLIGEGKPSATFDAYTGKRLQVRREDLRNLERIEVHDQLGLIAKLSSNERQLQVIEKQTKKSYGNSTPIN
jgi:WD40 repeat protein